jgi:hypothetical protein
MVASLNTFLAAPPQEDERKARHPSQPQQPQQPQHPSQPQSEQLRQEANRVAAALIAALRSGESAGGDARGKQAAAVLVVAPGAGYGGIDDHAVDLRVDDHPDPVAELQRIFDVFLENQKREQLMD